MGRELVQRDQLSLTEAEKRNPFLMLPEEYRGTVGFFAVARANLLKSPASLCAVLKVYIARGLTVEDLRRILNRSLDPELMRSQNFDNQVIADLAAMADDVLKIKRGFRNMLARRHGLPESLDTGPISLAEAMNERDGTRTVTS